MTTADGAVACACHAATAEEAPPALRALKPPLATPPPLPLPTAPLILALPAGAAALDAAAPPELSRGSPPPTPPPAWLREHEVEDDEEEAALN